MCVVRVHLAFSLSRVAIVILFVSKGASSVRDGTVIDFDVSGDLNFARGSLRLNTVLCPVIYIMRRRGGSGDALSGAAALFLHIQEKGKRVRFKRQNWRAAVGLKPSSIAWTSSQQYRSYSTRLDKCRICSFVATVLWSVDMI